MPPSRPALPPLNALRAFDAVVRLGSVSAAASALDVAPSTVTQHLRNLEDHLGASLFERSANAITPNARALAYAEAVRAGFDQLFAASEAVAERLSQAPIRLSAAPTLAGVWLARLIAQVEAEFPGVAIRCDFSPQPADVDADQVDIALRYGAGPYPGAVVEPLYTDVMAPVCTPRVAAGLAAPEDLVNALRIDTAETAPDGRSLWAWWAQQAAGDSLALALAQPGRWQVQGSGFTQALLLEAPTVAVMERGLIAGALASGALVTPFAAWVPAPCGYALVTSRRRVLRPAAKRLKALIKRHASQALRRPE